MVSMNAVKAKTTEHKEASNPYLSIIMPAYNEEKNIVKSLSSIYAYLKDYDYSYEILVVDDGSFDNTAKIVQEFCKNHKGFKLVRNPHKGKGPTIWTGVMTAKGEYIYLADADMAAQISEIKRLFVWLVDESYDIAIASREGLGSSRINEPYYRHLMGRVFNLWVRLIAVSGIEDTQCGFKLFRKNSAKEIFKRLKIYGDSAKEIKEAYLGAFDVEVLYLAKKLGFKVKEVPVTWMYVKTQRINPIKDSVKMALDVLKVRVNDIRGLYKL
ncbi:glycosyl transferase [candidate division WWE3 bacterium CG23_combo_of_CG06-09_8_20_14_all_40_14]|uniref:dolichyl-phosphate beta-glucosyltransferase n=1 Tax=candidate division WWE3 bacterium CG23_combo_of_CG06-09_8_20_14_all_40_14 TaxID=1975095 RepID=A0A2G9XBL4_UNCKA|nr:MAG: glycosyl transferase [candidate division WWE3 bacterium CG23_combo_of_CG06-09_8_20_14_all_40_14]